MVALLGLFMQNVADIIFKSKFSKSVAKSLIVTIVFFAAIDQFVTVILKNTAVLLLAIITFYLLFNIFAFVKKK